MIQRANSMTRLGIQSLRAIGLSAVVVALSVGTATAQTTTYRIVGVSYAELAAAPDDETGKDTQRAASTSVLPPVVASEYPIAQRQREQELDVYSGLCAAATKSELAARQTYQPAALPSRHEFPRNAPSEQSLAGAGRQPAAASNGPMPPSSPSPDVATGTREAVVAPDTVPETAGSFGAAAGITESPCSPCDAPLLFGCPYYPTQSGTRTICGVDCGKYGAPCCATWHDSHLIPWSLFGPGEYVGPARPEHVSTYYVRVDDIITVTFIASRKKSAEHYRIGVGDRLRIESKSDETLNREVQVQPDGEINLPLIGDIEAAGKTVKELRVDLTEHFGRIERQPLITVTPLEINNGLQEIIKAVTSQSRSAGQALDLRVTPEGTIQAPGLGSVYVQGLTLEEVRTELEARYAATFGPGLLLSPALTQRATSYVFVGGEVTTPGRYTLEGPTTVMQAIALAGGWNNGGNVRQVVVFRRDENWCLKATKIDVCAPLYGKDPCPVDDVWLRDNDLVIVPKSRILCAADVIELYFTRGVYAVFPITFVKDFSQGSSIVPVP